MSSNIEVQRICQFCGVEFTAKTTVTKFCSTRCSSRAIKKRIRESKIEISNKETSIQLNSTPYANLNNYGEFLTVPKAAGLMGVSRFTVYRYLQDSIIGCVKLRGKTFVRRQDIDALFESAGAYVPKAPKERQSITEFYTAKEIMEKFKCKESWAYRLMKANNIPRVSQRGRTVYSKPHIDKAFAKQQPDASITEWYRVEDIKELFGMTEVAIYSFVYENNIPKKKEGRHCWYSKRHFDAAKGIGAPVKQEYYSTEEAMAKYGLTRDSLYHIIKRHSVPKIQEGRCIKISKPELDKIFEKPIIP